MSLIPVANLWQVSLIGVNDIAGKFSTSVNDTAGYFVTGTAGVVDTSSKFATGTAGVDTSGKFAAGVIDTVANLSPM